MSAGSGTGAEDAMWPTDAEIFARLVGEMDYPDHGARLVAEKLRALAPRLRQPFLTWWTTGQSVLVAVEEVSLQTLMERYEMNPIAALLTLDWLIRDPEPARESLRRGYDRVVGRPRPRPGPRDA